MLTTAETESLARKGTVALTKFADGIAPGSMNEESSQARGALLPPTQTHSWRSTASRFGQSRSKLAVSLAETTVTRGRNPLGRVQPRAPTIARFR